MDTQQAIELLKRLIATPSVSRDEATAADIVEAEFSQMGFVPRRVGNNIWVEAWEHDELKPTILLDAHIDTVKPNAQWSRDPFAPTIEGDRLYGLGSNDTGGSLVAMIAAFSQLAKTEQPYNLIMLASAEEEVTGVNGVRAVLPELGKIDFAIVGEPTGMNPAVAEKGLMVLDCTAYGVAGHAAREEGVNAIYKALKDIEWFRTHCFERVSPMLGPVKMSVTGVQAGTQHNVVPDTCRFVVDIRSNGLYTNEEILAILRPMLRSTITPRSTRLNASSTPLDTPIIQRAQALGIPIYGSPTMSNMALLACPKVKFGPGDSSRSHTANEYIHIHEIEQAIELLKKLLIQNS